MNQRFVAGLGNLTVDEVLWQGFGIRTCGMASLVAVRIPQARIAPRRSVASLDDRERELVHAKVRKVLEDSIRVGRVPGKKSWITGARSRDDPTCPRCHRRLERATAAGRTSYWCGSCQA